MDKKSRTPQEAVNYVRQALMGKGTPKPQPLPKPEQLAGKTAARSRFNVLIPLADGRFLAYNTRHAAFAMWQPEDRELYERVGREKMPLGDAELEKFLPGGFLISDDMDEVAVLEKYYRNLRFNAGNMNLTLAPTLGCNFGCDYCYQGEGKSGKKMTKKVQEAVMAHLEAVAPSLRRVHVAWYGGEPTLAVKTILAMSERMRAICRQTRTNYTAFMVSNGYALTRSVVQELVKQQVTTYQVTLDGPADYHNARRALLSGKGTYDRILVNLKEIIEANLPVQIMIRINIDERNREGIRGLIDDLVERGFAGKKRFRIYFAPVRASTMGCRSCSEKTLFNAVYGRLESELHRYAFDKGLAYLPMPPRMLGNCQAVRPKGMIVLPNGDLHKCWDTVSESHLKSGSIFDIDAFNKDLTHKKWLDFSPFDVEACRQCAMLPSCMGFCAYRHLYPDLTHGEAASVPCPSWRYNINERLFLRAEKRGFVTRELWDEKRSPTVALDDTGSRLTSFCNEAPPVAMPCDGCG